MTVPRFTSALTALCLLATVAAAAEPAAPAENDITVYRGASLIDGTGAPLRPNMAIIVKGAAIEAVVPVAQLPGVLPAGAKIVDASGLYVLPGLINSHVHLATYPARREAEALLRRDLYGGVTAVRDMAGDARALADLARSSLLGDIPAPDIYYAALIAGPSFFDDPRVIASAQGAKAGQVPWLQAITDRTDLRLAVAEARGTFATGIKIYANLPGPLVARIAHEAHRQGIMVWAHSAVFPASPAQVIDAGADVVSHVCMLAYQASETMPPQYQNRAPVEEAKFAGDNAIAQNLFAEMRRRGTILDATLWVYEEIERQNAKQANSRPSYCSAALAERLLNQAYRAGVRISAGSDGEAEASDLYTALHQELVLLVDKGGMTPMDAIRAATSVGAMTIGREKEMGTVEAGKLANLVFVAKNPLDDIGNLRNVAMVVKRGAIYRRGDYRPISSDEVQSAD